MNQQMYALVNYTYDYYEFEQTIAVSKGRNVLKKKYNSLIPKDEREDCPLFNDTFSKIGDWKTSDYREREIRHYAIEPIEFLED